MSLRLPAEFELIVRRLGVEDAPIVQAVCDASADYHVLLYGEPAAPSEGLNVLTEVPPGRSLEDKFTFGFFERGSGRPRGVLDLHRGYRVTDEWYLGLLLLDPALRARRLGTAIMDATLEWLREEGARSARLVVAEQNVAARRFWERFGFVADRTFPPKLQGRREVVLTEFRRVL